jgi:cyclopropane fatty-acyl-phospholipid synthase-like methyltransferase
VARGWPRQRSPLHRYGPGVSGDFDFNISGQAGAAWLDRAQRAATMLASVVERVGPGASLADVGCGDEKLRLVLENQGVGFTYAGFDVNPQSERVTRFDATKDRLPGDFDAVVSLGLIEYIDIPAYFAKVRAHSRYFVVSHVVRERNKYNRKKLDRLGWVNHLSTGRIDALLADAGFKVEQRVVTDDGRTVIWLCGELTGRQVRRRRWAQRWRRAFS